MTKRQKIDQLIEEHKCQVSLRVHSPEMLLASYSYDWDADTSCWFTLFSEVAESLQDAFDAILKRRGLVPCGSLKGTDRPFVQDLLTPEPHSPAGKRFLKWMGQLPVDNGSTIVLSLVNEVHQVQRKGRRSRG